MKRLLLCLALLFVAFPAFAQDVTGQWQGVLKAPNKDLRMILKIAKDDGRLSGTAWSIDQGLFALKCSGMRFEGGVLSFDVDVVAGKYQGKLNGEGNTFTGTWTQGPTSLPLTFVHATPETAWEIPAPPPPPKLMAPDADPSFEVATIKPNPSGASGLQGLVMQGRNFRVRNGSAEDLIAFAYGVQNKQIMNAPEWAESDRYDIDGVPDKEGAPNPNQLRTMIRKLLAERYGLQVHQEKREMPAFVLADSKTGAKVSPTQLKGPLPGFGISPGEGGLRLNIVNGSMDEFAGFLQMIVLDRPVVNHTTLKDRYDFHVNFTPDDSQFHGHPPNIRRGQGAGGGAAADPAAPAADSAPNLFEAMQQQVGIRLAPEKTQVDVFVIDRIEKPSAN